MALWVDNTEQALKKNKIALLVRYGAYGDMIIITPVIQRLKDLGYYIILNTSKRGLEVFKHDDRIDEFIEHKTDVPLDALSDYWDEMKKEVKHDLFINFSESIECNVALHPRCPVYIYPKQERYAKGNRNYYDASNVWSGVEGCETLPSLQFTQDEEKQVRGLIKEEKYNIVWCLSGSGKNKAYPWTDYVMGETIKKYPDVHFITIGDNRCQILEDIVDEFPKENVTQMAGKISIRHSLLLTKVADLVISPDTGVLHASGCYDTPKIGLLGHTTIENITKYFSNDFSIESQCECAPCFRLIYDYKVQCPIDPKTHASWCMAKIRPEQIFGRIVKVRDKQKVLV